MLVTLHPVARSPRTSDDVMRTAFGTATNVTAFDPAIDVTANDDGIVLVCDVPGTRKEDLEITVENRTLTLKGTRRFDSEQGEQVLLGRAYGSFTRRFALSDDVDIEQLHAELTDGVLSIRLPTHPPPAPRTIPIVGPVEPRWIGG
jgi:HSP20 family protein